MKIEVKDLMDDNELLSHIFLGCIEKEDLRKIKEKYVHKDWREESVKIPVEMKIGGISVNPKGLFDEYKKQMSRMIEDKARELLSEKISGKMSEMINRIMNFEEILKDWESDINWDAKNPLI